MVAEVTVRVDGKGRLIIPKSVRERLHVRAGDTFFLRADGDILRYAKAGNPFDPLADLAVEQHTRGRTESLRQIPRDRDVRTES